MKFRVVLLFSSMLMISILQAQIPNFNTIQDQSRWNSNFQTCPPAANQFPLTDIDKNQLVYDNSLEALYFEGYNIPLSAAIVNDAQNGRISVRIDVNHGPKIRFGYYFYNLQQLSFKWSQFENVGSQHLFNGHSFPLELQMLHTREVVPLGENIFNSPNMVVISVLFDWMYESNEILFQNRELTKITNQIMEVATPGRTSFLREPLIVQSFLPLDYSSYVRYTGSLSVPPCSDNVEWLVMTHTLNVTRNQMQQFRQVQTFQQQPRPNFVAGASFIDIPSNYRFGQLTEGRVFKLRNDIGYLNGSQKISHCTPYLYMIICFLFFYIHVQFSV